MVEGRPASLGARAFDVLLALVERRDRVVSKDELLDAAWPGLEVEENNLQVQVSTLRKLLGRGAIATIPGRGYQFTLQAAELDRLEERTGRVPEDVLTNVATAVEALVGRAADIDGLHAMLEAKRLVTVLGAGGIGKTRLAREVARGRVARHEHGVWWVDLANVASGSGVANSIASAARLKLGSGDAAALLPAAMAGRSMLLVLDNCEHVVETAAGLVSACLAAAPHLQVLATSQAPLHLQGESLYRLEPLDVPSERVTEEEARTCASLQLFERRARAVDRRFALDPANLPAAATICRDLAGLPLAIEMAAARAPLIGAEALSRKLRERLDVLRSGQRDVAPRYASLQATLDWSHSLLDEAERVVLCRLSVFHGSFALEPAQQACAHDGMDEWAVMEALAGLVDKSLVQLESQAPPRYRLLETTRMYARLRLGDRGEPTWRWRATGTPWHASRKGSCQGLNNR